MHRVLACIGEMIDTTTNQMSTQLLRFHMSNVFSSSVFPSCGPPSFDSLTVWWCPPYHSSLDLYSFILVFQGNKSTPSNTREIQQCKYLRVFLVQGLHYLSQLKWTGKSAKAESSIPLSIMTVHLYEGAMYSKYRPFAVHIVIHMQPSNNEEK